MQRAALKMKRRGWGNIVTHPVACPVGNSALVTGSHSHCSVESLRRAFVRWRLVGCSGHCERNETKISQRKIYTQHVLRLLQQISLIEQRWASDEVELGVSVVALDVVDRLP